MNRGANISRLVKYRGEWLVMQSNIQESDQRHDIPLERFEEDAIYVRNEDAAKAPLMRAALEGIMQEMEKIEVPFCQEIAKICRTALGK